MTQEIIMYKDLLVNIKTRVRQGQLRASSSANAEMLATYWDIGKIIHELQQTEGWGKGVIPRLANDLKNEFSEMKGFSVRNIQFVIQFYFEYAEFGLNTKLTVSQNESISRMSFWQPPIAKLQNHVDKNKVSEKLNLKSS